MQVDDTVKLDSILVCFSQPSSKFLEDVGITTVSIIKSRSVDKEDGSGVAVFTPEDRYLLRTYFPGQIDSNLSLNLLNVPNCTQYKRTHLSGASVSMFTIHALRRYKQRHAYRLGGYVPL